MTQRRYHVLFLCRFNSARSIMAEAILNSIGGATFRAFSAGSEPAGEINAEAWQRLVQTGVATEDLHSKSWERFVDGPELDFVFTLCDTTANETCPTWPGQPITAHWPFPDPAKVTGTAAERAALINDIHRQIYNRLAIFTALPIAKLDRLKLQQEVDALGQGEPSSA